MDNFTRGGDLISFSFHEQRNGKTGDMLCLVEAWKPLDNETFLDCIKIINGMTRLPSWIRVRATAWRIVRRVKTAENEVGSMETKAKHVMVTFSVTDVKDGLTSCYSYCPYCGMKKPRELLDEVNRAHEKTLALLSGEA